MVYHYNTQGTCSRAIDIEIDDDKIIKSIKFSGGCMGNTQGVSALVVGMHVEDVIRRLKGIECGGKGTSCPDQLALALKAIEEMNA